MTLQKVLQLKAAEKVAKDAFYAVHSTVDAGGTIPATYGKLQAAMVAATRARQQAMLAYAATL